MSKFLVETHYTCTFKTIHELDELNEKELSNIDNRKDGKVEIISVTVNNRKTKKSGDNKKGKKLDLKDNLKAQNISSEIYSCHTLKPFDYNGLRKIFKKFKLIVIIEDHSKIGGLNSIVKTHAYENRYNGKIISYSLKDEFIHCYGSQDDLLEKHNISSKKIYQNIMEKIK